MSEAGGEERRAREAAEWLTRLNSRSVSREELNAFYEWRRDPDNAAAYARGEQLWHDARSLGDDRDIAEAVREALERPRLEAGRARSPRLSRRALLAGGGLLVAAGGAGWLLLAQPDRYRTAVGEQLLVSLDDGSRIRLNTDTALKVRYSRNRRHVEISQGQAFFEVRPEPDRPFEVETDGLIVQALGTRFDVRTLGGGDATVVLAEGRVRVAARDQGWSELLTRPGAMLTLAHASSPGIGQADLEAATSWTTGRLVFRETPLAQAIAEVNRYSEKKIELRAPDLGDREVDGVFQTGDIDSFVAALTALFPLESREASADRIVLTRI